ncbi:MAG: OmpA family protein [Fulvivirga sp.]|uniref:OmpA family protein n=1 Tax=Fulvivirga sp. TaxID=1931237 RepID=UPI0032EE2127
MKLFLTVFLSFAFTILFAQEYSQRYELVNLGRKVNTAYHEGAPVISADGKVLYFFVHNHPENTYGKEGSQDIWYSEMGEDGQWGEAKHMGKPLNENQANQVFTVMPDNETLFIRGGGSKNREGFSFTHKEGASWSKPEDIDVEDFKNMHKGKFYGATMSTDAKFMVLYFSERDNSEFNDLYLSKNLGDNKWSRPVRLGANINTSRDEFAPFLAPDNKTLYFSSTRKDMGLGYSDIYKTVRLDDTWMNWSDPVNVGRPLNTRAYDAYLSIDNHNNVFTTQSGNTIDGGNLDIFSLKLKDIHINLKGLTLDLKTGQGIPDAHMTIVRNDEIIDTLMSSPEATYSAVLLEGNGDFAINVSADGYHPGLTEFSLGEITHDTTVIKDIMLQPIKKKVLLSGIAYDEKTGDPLIASLEFNLPDSDKTRKLKTNEAGYYEIELPKTGVYRMVAKAEGYLNANDSLEHYDDEITAYTKDLYLKPIEIGTTVRLNNIFFDFDKTTLKSESFVELDKVVEFLQENRSLEIEIAGHTDSKGSDDYNLNLSQGRAEAVVDYIISNGIEEYRLVAKGYGESVPLESNDTDEGRAFNRRVEFTVLRK